MLLRTPYDAGPNGAGKTTFANRFLPDFVGCRHFVNTDLIAAGLSPYSPELAAVEAGRLMLKRMDELAQHKVDFGFETTLATRSLVSRIKTLQKMHYEIHLFYLWVQSPDLAAERVAKRVEKGGHDVPFETIRRRYFYGIRYLVNLYMPMCDTWTIFDNSGNVPVQVAFGDASGVIVEGRNVFNCIIELSKGKK